VLYIAGEYEEAQQHVKLYIPKTLSKVLKEIASSIGGSIEISYGGSEAVSTSIALFKAIRIALESVVRRLSKGRRIIVVVDEVRVDGEELLSSFRGWLEVFLNEIGYANLSYRDRTGGSITIVTLVSDALVTEIRRLLKRKLTRFSYGIYRREL
jgi:hypothetical protein